jgi:hypothetical protein
VHATGAPPIVVIGNTDDPATPLSGAEALARELPDARLVVNRSEAHTAFGDGNACVDDPVIAYLTDLQLPPPTTRCS